jgi:hypothetical protein
VTNQVLGIYKKTDFSNNIEVGTPDPTRYHDASSIELKGVHGNMTSRMRANTKFSLPGVIVPRATQHGASLGNDHERPMEIVIDPEFTGGQLVIDLEKIRRNPDAMVSAYNKAKRKGYSDASDTVIEAYGEFAKTLTKQDIPEAPREREAPVEMPHAYVVPKAPTGVTKAASFTKKSPRVYVDPDAATAGGRYEQDAGPTEAVVAREVRSLYDQINQVPQVAGYAVHNQPKAMTQVLFELPVPGQPGRSMGRFSAQYHHVIVEDKTMVLVYDHSQPSQSVYFPEPIPDPGNDDDTMAIAVCVIGEVNKLYRAWPTTVTFKHRNEQFCVLQVEFIKDIPKD